MMPEFFSLFCYERWYHEDIKQNLTVEQKTALAKKISELSLREPIFLPGKEYPHEDFSKLAPFSHTGKFSGLQLYAVYTEIMKELGCNVPSASQVALKGDIYER